MCGGKNNGGTDVRQANVYPDMSTVASIPLLTFEINEAGVSCYDDNYARMNEAK